MSQDQILNSIASLLVANGLTVEDLAAHRGVSESGSVGPTMEVFVDRAARGLTKNTARSYQTHFAHLLNGIPRQCECVCSTCVDQFVADGTCACECAKSAKSAASFPATLGLRLSRRAIEDLDLELFVQLVQRMAIKRARHDNVVRAGRGLAPKPTHGQGAREMAVTALRHLFGRMAAKGLTPTNPAAGLKKGHRSGSRRRALDDTELAELFHVVASGGDDPELDVMLPWSSFELGARRGGLISLSVGALDRETQMVRLHEMGDHLADQPCSRELIDALLNFARTRGGTCCIPGHPGYDPNAPVFYYIDSSPERPHSLTSRRFDSLHRRVQLAIPWAKSIAYSGHDLRHTLGTMIEREASFETARRALRHAGAETTSTYTKATTQDVARAIARITGRPHPLARG